MTKALLMWPILFYVAVCSARWCQQRWGAPKLPNSITLIESHVNVTVPSPSGNAAQELVYIFPAVYTDYGLIQPLLVHGTRVPIPTVPPPDFGLHWGAAGAAWSFSGSTKHADVVPVSAGEVVGLHTFYMPDTGIMTSFVTTAYNGIIKPGSGVNITCGPPSSYILALEFFGDFNAMMPPITFTDVILVFDSSIWRVSDPTGYFHANYSTVTGFGQYDQYDNALKAEKVTLDSRPCDPGDLPSIEKR